MYDMNVDFSHRDSTMPAIKYKVNLSDDEKLQLETLLRKGKSAARSQTRARILLKAATGLQDKNIIQHWAYLFQWWQKHVSDASKKARKRH